MIFLVIVGALIFGVLMADEHRLNETRRLRREREAEEAEEAFSRVEGECPECDGRGSIEGERCPTCQGTKWVKPSRSGYYWIPIGMPSWAKRAAASKEVKP